MQATAWQAQASLIQSSLIPNPALQDADRQASSPTCVLAIVATRARARAPRMVDYHRRSYLLPDGTDEDSAWDRRTWFVERVVSLT